jgi:hypothetical protein
VQVSSVQRSRQTIQETAMKPTSMLITPRALGAAALLVLAPLVQAHECTLADAAGKYGYTSSGTIVTPAVGPFTAVGHTTLTESGTFSGAQTTSIAGNLVEEALQGTYTVNADCTGSSTVYVYHGATLARTSHLYIVWDSHQSEARAIFLTPGTAINILFRKMSDE